MAKRSCRRSDGEDRIHDRAVKIRKMTDSQIVSFIDGCVEEAEKSAFKQGVEAGRKSVEQVRLDIPSIIEEILGIKGIGLVRAKRIRSILEAGVEKCRTQNGR